MAEKNDGVRSVVSSISIHHQFSDADEADMSSSVLSKTDQMAYLMQELGLDHPTAILLYRAQRLQDKGQLKQSLKYYEKVLRSKPDCLEASENHRMVAELLQEEEEEKEKKKVKEESAKKEQSRKQKEANQTPHDTSTKEMQVGWSACENFQFHYYPDPDEAAFRAAKSQLRKAGYGNSLLKLIDNKILEDVCNAETEWARCMAGRALFQVTLLKDPYEDHTQFDFSL